MNQPSPGNLACLIPEEPLHAHCVGDNALMIEGVQYVGVGASVICAVARKLIKSGVSEERKLLVLRDGRPVFERDLSLREWAGFTIRENGPPTLIRYRAPSHLKKLKEG